MPILMKLTWEGLTPALYDRVRSAANWEGDKPTGGMFHVAAFSSQGLEVCDVWESAEDFNRFVQDRLMPAVARVGIQGEPKVEILQAHAVFAPAFRKI